MSVLDLVLVALRLAIGAWLLWSLPRLDRDAGRGTGVVSIVVPARDEETQLPHLLGSLAAQDGLGGRAVEVVVVDDGSTDRTAAVAAGHGATVVHPPPLPPGWTGKAWACAVGAGEARGDVLIFVDADVRFAPGGLGRVLATLDRSGGLVSVQPHHHPGSPVEHLAAVFNVVAVAGTDAASPLGRARGSRGAFGPVLATSRADHDAVGGHAVAAAAVVDDVALAEAYRAAGLPVTIRGGADDVAFRMYPGGLRQLVEGFTKNLSAGAGAVRRTTVALVALWLSLLVQGGFGPVAAAGAGRWDEAGGTGALLALHLVVAAQVWWMARKVGRFGPLTALAYPVLVAAFLGVFVASAVATARGRVRWRGRDVPTRPAR